MTDSLHDFYGSCAIPKNSARPKARKQELAKEKRDMAAYLKSHPVCELCRKRPATSVHHLIPKSSGGSRDPRVHSALNMSSRCTVCHGAEHGEKVIL